MKLLIAANTSWNLVHFRSNLIRRLQSLDLQIVACAPRDQFTEAFDEMSVSFHETPIQQRGIGLLRDILLIVRYLRIVRSERPSVILTFTIKPNLYLSLAAAVYRIPIINNISGLGYSFLDAGLLRRFVIFLYRLLLKKSFRVFFQNSEDRTLFTNLRLVSDSQSYLLPGSGVDTSRFQYVPIQESTELTFLFIGRLLNEKGIREYLDAARSLLDHGRSARFLVLGALPEDSVRKNEIFEKMRSLGGFGKYLGVMQDVRPAIAGSHCVVLPSYREGTPRSILEASAMGRPVIVTDVPGCRNAVKKNASGFLCRPQSAADLGSKMKDMLDLTEQKREEMGRAGSEFVREHFDEKIVIDAYLTAIRACAVGGV